MITFGGLMMPVTDDEMEAVVKRAFDADGVVAVDTETSGLWAWRPEHYVGGVALSSKTVKGVYVPIRHNTALETGDKKKPFEFGPGHKLNFEPKRVLGLLRDLMKGRKVVMHNAKFDCEMFACDPDVPFDPWHTASVVHDTMIMSQLLHDDRRTHALKPLATRLLNIKAPEQDRVKNWLKAAKSQDNYLNCPPDIMAPYAAGDTWRTYLLYEKLWPEVVRQELTTVYQVELDVMPMIASAELIGVRVDRGYMAAQAEYGKKEMERLSYLAAEIAGREVNLGSYQDVDKMWTYELGLERRMANRYHKGKGYVDSPTYDEETISTVDHPIVECILGYRKWQKLVGTYFEGLLPFIDDDGRLHPQFFQSSTVTGRMASAKPNMQNIPRGDAVKNAFVADPSDALLFMDYSQFEYRMFVHYCNAPGLVEQYKDPEFDMHQAITDRLGAQSRTTGKTLNFAMLYGMGPSTYSKKYANELNELIESAARGEATVPGAERCRTPMQLATMLFNRYHDSVPAVRRFSRLASSTMSKRGYVRTLWGRRRRHDGNNAWKAVNSLIQGSTSDFFKFGIAQVGKAFWPSRDLFDSPFRLFIHDELVVSMPNGLIEEVKDGAPTGRLRELMACLAESMPLRVPVVVDLKASTTRWSESYHLARYSSDVARED